MATLDLFGLEHTEKALLCVVVTGEQARALCAGLTYEMMIDLPDQGIAVSVSLASLGGQTALDYFLADVPLTEKTEEDAAMQENNASSLALIIAIAEKGQTDLVMGAAREEGARGETVVHAKGTAGAGTKTFFGVSLAEEKEMISIVSDAEQGLSIMRSIMHHAGVDTNARAVVFSLPITEACGVRYGNG